MDWTVRAKFKAGDYVSMKSHSGSFTFIHLKIVGILGDSYRILLKSGTAVNNLSVDFVDLYYEKMAISRGVLLIGE